jgi:hypothetical protein
VERVNYGSVVVLGKTEKINVFDLMKEDAVIRSIGKRGYKVIKDRYGYLRLILNRGDD